jgi:hypothetical protein
MQFLAAVMMPVPPIPPWILYTVGGDISQILKIFGL